MLNLVVFQLFSSHSSVPSLPFIDHSGMGLKVGMITMVSAALDIPAAPL